MKDIKGKDQYMKGNANKQIDWIITIVPFVLIILMGILFFIFPERSNEFLTNIRYILGDRLGAFYLIIGFAFFVVSLILAFSKYGDVVLGNPGEKPKYSFFTWGSMMFTCGLAADILFYSFSEWVMYATNPHISEMGSIQEWSGVFPIFHWSLIPWAFYLVLAVAFGFMLHVHKRKKQKFSESCRPILGKYTDGLVGRFIDLLAVFALLAGTATTFSVATPLMASLIGGIFNIEIDRIVVTIVIILLTCCIYTYSLLHGFKGISILSKLCIYMFFGLLIYVLLLGGETRYIVETGLESLGRMIQNFVGLATYTDPLRKNNFAQDWTIYYWAYWMVWCVAAPFFIGNISKGRTIKQTILGGYIFGVGSTILSFIILGNYSMGLQEMEIYDFISIYERNGDLYSLIISIIDTMPGATFVAIVVLITMVAFYATSFDSIAYTAACYSYKELNNDESPDKLLQFFWCVLLVVLPIALIFSESSMNSIQSVSIIAAFPLGIVMILIVCSFIKSLKQLNR